MFLCMSNSAIVFSASQNTKVEDLKTFADANALSTTPLGDGSVTSTSLYKAIAKSDSVEVDRLLQYNTDQFQLVNPNFLATYNDGSTIPPLCLAVILNNKPIVESLLKANADPDSIQLEPDGKTTSFPLTHAVIKGHNDIARLLLNNKANANSGIGDKNMHVFKSSLFIAISNISKEGADLESEEVIELIKLLLEKQAKVDLGYIDSNSDMECSPLWIAAKRGYVSIASLLINANASLNKKTFCETPYKVTKNKEIKNNIKSKVAQDQKDCSVCLEDINNKSLHFLDCCNEFLCLDCYSGIEPLIKNNPKKCPKCRSTLGCLDYYEHKNVKSIGTQTDTQALSIK